MLTEGGNIMNVVLIAHNRKKDLLIRFCEAYSVILKKHTLFSTEEFARTISEVVDCHVNSFLTKNRGGYQQIASRVVCNEMDFLVFFKDPLSSNVQEVGEAEIIRLCDLHSVPIATNMATAELIILGMERGDLDWRLVMSVTSLERLERPG
jgi:methylglyoxal synthase